MVDQYQTQNEKFDDFSEIEVFTYSTHRPKRPFYLIAPISCIYSQSQYAHV